MNNFDPYRSRTSSTASSIFNTRKSLVQCIIEYKFCEFCHENIELDQFNEHLQTCPPLDLDQDDMFSTPRVSPLTVNEISFE